MNPTTRLAAVLGWPIGHSRSPQIMNAAFAALGIDAVLVAIGVPPDGLAAAVAGLRAQGALGASVTIPHKLSVVALCDEVSEAARMIGAVNCLHIIGERLIGHNTDEGGFIDGLHAAGFVSRAPRAVLLGAGGAARAVAYALRAGTVDVIARRPDEVTWTRARPWSDEQLRAAFGLADLVVDCTSLGLGGADEIAVTDALPLDALPREAWVATLVYHRATRLLERALDLGRPTLDGRAMLVHQAARAFGIWTGQAAPIEIMTKSLDDDLRAG
ncbi:MAG: shikimate dehydrogenase [Deltaproteobacteria bacterium]|nr:shikimate dehydrogenase [Deltaproteobacteria bacterium]